MIEGVSDDVRTRKDLLTYLATTPEVTAALLDHAQSPEAGAYLDRFLNSVKSSGLGYVNLFDTKGDLVISTIKGTGKINVADRPFFQPIISGKKGLFLSYQISRATQKPVVAYSVPIRGADGSVIGLMLSGQEMADLTKSLNAVKIGTTGFAALLEGEGGTVLAHPNAELILKTDFAKTPQGQAVMAVKDQAIVEADGRLLAVSRDAETGLLLLISAPVEDMNVHVAASTRANLLIGACVTLVLLAVLFWLTRRVVLTPLSVCSAFALAVSHGRFEESLALKRTDEIGSLADALREMLRKLRQSFEEVTAERSAAQRHAEKANQACQEAVEANGQAERARQEGMLAAASRLQDVVEAMSDYSQELSSRIHQAGQGTQDQMDRTRETATAMEEMNATVLGVAKNATEAAASSNDARHKAQDGAGIVGKVVSGIAEVQRQALGMKEDMGVLGKQAEGIGQIMNVISDIADQTNLLALNAAIEAARAGEAGRGFAVVADEVRKLAEKTMSATKEVGNAIQGIQQGTRKNMDNVDRTTRTIEEATALAKMSGETLDEIVRRVEYASDQVRSIATASEEQSATSEEINHSMEQVAAISSDTAQAMEHASLAVSELIKQTEVLQNLIVTLKSEGGIAAIGA
nr:methyl-accepting chemotaxis protein [Desulfovibrio sp. TomC]